MKKLIALSLALTLCCIPLTASALAAAPNENLLTVEQDMYTSPKTEVLTYVIVDQVTGVNYIAMTNKAKGGTSIITRMTADNKPYVTKVS